MVEFKASLDAAGKVSINKWFIEWAPCDGTKYTLFHISLLKSNMSDLTLPVKDISGRTHNLTTTPKKLEVWFYLTLNIQLSQVYSLFSSFKLGLSFFPGDLVWQRCNLSGFPSLALLLFALPGSEQWWKESRQKFYLISAV